MINSTAPNSDFLLYQTEDGHTRIEVRFAGDTAWLLQNQMSDLFQSDKSLMSKHITDIFHEGELKEVSQAAKFAAA